LDFSHLATWLVEAVGGTTLWGAYYYTGVERGEGADSEGQKNLARFLEMLEQRRGFFVKRFPRKVQRFQCVHCGRDNRFSQEKEVDTTMVADMLRLAAVGAFDIAILVSGDADHAPAVEGIRALGKQVFVASWGYYGLSQRIRKAAFDHIDLMDALNNQPPRQLSRETESAGDASAKGTGTKAFLDEVLTASRHFDEKGGYVGVHFFLNRWASERLEPSPEIRQRLMDKLIREGKLEVYDAPDGNKALRVIVPADDQSG